jgi:flavodoxin I
MAKIGIFFGSSTGNTEEVAQQLQETLGGDADTPRSVAGVTADELTRYEALILGTSTWGEGDLQDDWDDALSTLEATDLSGKKVALFGLGDQEGYPDSFVDGIGTLAASARKAGATVVGYVSTEGYEFDASQAVEGNDFVGLPLDNDNEADKTTGRISAWAERLKGELA